MADQLPNPFDIHQMSVTVNGSPIDHLAGPEMGGVNSISPVSTGTEMPLIDARGDPVGRVYPCRFVDTMAMVVVSVLANAPSAVTMLEEVDNPGNGGDGVTVAIASGVGGTVFSTVSADHVVFSAAPYDFDSGMQAMVFTGTGWNYKCTDITA